MWLWWNGQWPDTGANWALFVLDSASCFKSSELDHSGYWSWNTVITKVVHGTTVRVNSSSCSTPPWQLHCHVFQGSYTMGLWCVLPKREKLKTDKVQGSLEVFQKALVLSQASVLPQSEENLVFSCLFLANVYLSSVTKSPASVLFVSPFSEPAFPLLRPLPLFLHSLVPTHLLLFCSEVFYCLPRAPSWLSHSWWRFF